MENEVASTINREYKDRLFKFIFRPDENVPLNKNCTPLYHYTKFISKGGGNRYVYDRI